jgi:hypothetical protein
MNKIEIALQNLRPGVDWVLPGEQILSNVQWPIGIEPPTQAEVDAEVQRLLLERSIQRGEAALSAAIQAHIDAPAKAWGYDDARSAVSYVGDAYPRFDAEGQAIKAFRSDCWRVAGIVRASVLAGTRQPPTIEEMLALLPDQPTRPEVAP